MLKKSRFSKKYGGRIFDRWSWRPWDQAEYCWSLIQWWAPSYKSGIYFGWEKAKKNCTHQQISIQWNTTVEMKFDKRSIEKKKFGFHFIKTLWRSDRKGISYQKRENNVKIYDGFRFLGVIFFCQHVCAPWRQGCQIFLGPKIPKREKYTKGQQTTPSRYTLCIPNDHT
jgi:hypothetical protein